MTTPTARYALSKIVEATDNVDVVADFNNNWDAIDLKLGSQPCTSSTRPSAPVEGMQIFESDTGATRTYSGSAWLPAEIMIATSSAMPSNPITGDLVYITNHPSIALWNGSAWMYQTLAVVTSTTRPVSFITNGTVIYETDTKRFLIYNGTAWENKAFANFVCTSTTHPATPFQGLEIYETDTGLNAVYTGSAYSYQMTQIAPTQILSATTASVTFSSIPAVNNLVLKWRVKSNTTLVDLGIRVDGSSTAANYLSAKVSGRGSAATSAAVLGTDSYGQIGLAALSTPASYFSNGSLEIAGWGTATGFLSYSGTSAVFDTSSSYAAEVYAGLYLAVGPHTSLTVLPASGSFVAGSTFALYAAP